MSSKNLRLYSRYFDASADALEVAVDNFNRVHPAFRTETAVIMLAISWELLAKAVLLKTSRKIDARGDNTISGKHAVLRLHNQKIINKDENDTIQMIISLRDESAHGLLPEISIEMVQHLIYFGIKAHRRISTEYFRSRSKTMPEHFLAMSFGDLTTFADKVAKSLTAAKRSPEKEKLVWLLERGLTFDGAAYESRKEVTRRIQNGGSRRKKLHVDRYASTNPMVRLIPVEAPKNMTADLVLRKGDRRDATLPVIVKQVNEEEMYPYFTAQIATRLGKDLNWVAKAAKTLNLKGDPRYHFAGRSSASQRTNRYSEEALQFLMRRLREKPEFNPYE